MEQRNGNCWEDSGKWSSLGNEDMCTPQGGKPAHSVGKDAKQESSSLFHSPERKEWERKRERGEQRVNAMYSAVTTGASSHWAQPQLYSLPLGYSLHGNRMGHGLNPSANCMIWSPIFQVFWRLEEGAQIAVQIPQRDALFETFEFQMWT